MQQQPEPTLPAPASCYTPAQAGTEKEEAHMADLSHITLNEAEGKADCATCQTGITAPPSFGGIRATDMLAAFVVQHATHTKAGVASGLTATGRPSKAARLALAAPASRDAQ